MRYFLVSRLDGERVETTYDKALDVLLGSYDDNDGVRDLLNHEQDIPCMFRIIEIRK